MARVLVVDDQELARVVVQQALEEGGHEVVTAATGAAMMHALLNGSYDVVVLDMRMPDVNGVRLARILRRNLEEPPRVVLFSGLPQEALARLSRRLGVREYLCKGCSSDALRATVARAAAYQGPAFDPPMEEFTPSGFCLPAPLEPAA